MKEFDYAKTVSEVEEMISKIENPDTTIPEAEKLTKDARKKLDSCYEYLRSERAAEK